MRSGVPSSGRPAFRRRHPVSCLWFLVCLLAARPAAPATVAGRVTDPDGRAVPHARVVLSGPLGPIAETQTTATGDYELANLADGRYELQVFADGFHAPGEAVDLTGDERQTIAVQLRLSAVEEAIVVSAAQVAVPRSEAAAAITVLTATDLRARQFETVADALRDVPGLAVVRSGGRGSLTAIFPRGGASNYTLVLVDGVRTNSFGGAFDFAHLPVVNVDRIEIVRGPQSALYGSEAIGAVVHVFTKNGGAPTLHGQLEAGNQGTTRATVGTAGGRGRLAWGFGAERYATDGLNGRAVRSESLTNDDYTRTTANGTLVYRHENGLDAGLAASIGSDTRGFPGPWGSDPIAVFPGIDRVSRGTNDTRRIGVHVGNPWSAAVRQRVEVSYADLASEFVSSFGPSASGTRRLDARLQEDLVIARTLTLSAGAEFVREQGRSTYVTGSAGAAIPITRRNVGLFVEARYAPAARLQLIGGVRLEHLVRGAVDADPLAFQPRPAFASQTVRSLNPKVAATWLVSRPGTSRRTTRLRASAGTGIRPPDVFEIAFTDNPDLQPERSRSLEVGLEQQLAGGAIVLDGALFANHYDDLIVSVGRVLGNASRWRTDNISNARARGLELTGRTRLPWGLQASASYTWLATELLAVDGLAGTAPPPFTAGDPLIRRPRHQGTVDLRYTASRFSAFTALSTRTRLLDLEPNYGSSGGLFFTPGYAVVDVGAALPLRRGLEIFGRVNNVANRRYEETLGYPALGRTAVAGVRVAAGL